MMSQVKYSRLAGDGGAEVPSGPRSVLNLRQFSMKPFWDLFNRRRKLSQSLFAALLAVSYVVVILATGAITRYLDREFSPSRSVEFDTCSDPPTRREWRGLKYAEKRDYIQAVQCLSSTPSIIKPEGTIFDDFSWVHMWVGRQCKHTLHHIYPWIAYWFNDQHITLHHFFRGIGCFFAYMKLRWQRSANSKDNCRIFPAVSAKTYSNSWISSYWDWGVDWQDLSNSSIWDSKHGFGGDGNLTGEVGVSGGRCVTDGPFSNMRLLNFNQTVQPHCLSRGFQKEPKSKESGAINGHLLEPEILGALRRTSDYARFRELIEDSIHNALHRSIGGDFTEYSAANGELILYQK